MSKPKISLAPPKSKIELRNYLRWLSDDFEVKILNTDDLIEGALVLCGGPDLGTNLKRDAFEIKLISQAVKQRLPILGVCRGMQILNFFLGGDVKDIDELPEHFFFELKHYFEEYKVLENKVVEIDNFQNKQDAFAIINEAIDFYKEKYRDKL